TIYAKILGALPAGAHLPDACYSGMTLPAWVWKSGKQAPSVRQTFAQFGISMTAAVASVLASRYLLPIVRLVGSNIFMTLAWYGHLRFKQVPLAGVIVASWLIAFIEYCMAVPANRAGSAV